MSVLENERIEGREEGREEGEKKEKRRIAKALKSKGVDYNIISFSTGLTRKEIDKL